VDQAGSAQHRAVAGAAQDFVNPLDVLTAQLFTRLERSEQMRAEVPATRAAAGTLSGTGDPDADAFGPPPTAVGAAQVVK